nr:JAB domain-containing protein [Longimicrobium terrae]
MRDLHQEELHVLLLNPVNDLLRDVVVARGTVDGVQIHPRDVFRPALAESAAKVVLVHNHPTGVPTPSPEDREITRRVVGAGRPWASPCRTTSSWGRPATSRSPKRGCWRCCSTGRAGVFSAHGMLRFRT